VILNLAFSFFLKTFVEDQEAEEVESHQRESFLQNEIVFSSYLVVLMYEIENDE
jgi:hypothetical protein